MTLVLAVDPGLTTGVCLVDSNGPTAIETAELAVEDVGPWIKKHLTHYSPESLALACETFTITAATAKNSQAPWSLKLIGVFEYLARDLGYEPPTMQSPANAKSFSSNQRLKALELWHVGGAGHALDSLRHAVLYMANHGWRDPRLLDGN